MTARPGSGCAGTMAEYPGSVPISQQAIPEQILFTPRQRTHPPDSDDRERITRARQAAEALFTPKQRAAEPSASGSDPPARKPRVLETAPAAPVRHEAVAASPEPRIKSAIPAAQFARIRAWVKYGMTVAQVAQLYGVAADEIERILRQA